MRSVELLRRDELPSEQPTGAARRSELLFAVLIARLWTFRPAFHFQRLGSKPTELKERIIFPYEDFIDRYFIYRLRNRSSSADLEFKRFICDPERVDQALRLCSEVRARPSRRLEKFKNPK